MFNYFVFESSFSIELGPHQGVAPGSHFGPRWPPDPRPIESPLKLKVGLVEALKPQYLYSIHDISCELKSVRLGKILSEI